jgi:hypothetical protein
MNAPPAEAVTEADALQRYPELTALVTMREAGWRFRVITNSDGEPECLVGSRSVQRYTDAIFIHDRTDVSAARVLDDAYGGGCVWKAEKRDLPEVVHDLLGLPEPDTPGAPTLVTTAHTLWTP